MHNAEDPGMLLIEPTESEIELAISEEPRDLTDKALSGLRGSGLSVGENLLCGFMIETPSSLWCLEDLLAAADFASIGTNDLVQFLLGVDRTSPDVGHFYQPEHPVVLRVLKRIASRARSAGKPVTLCGEMAHDPMLLPVLIGVGITEMSVPWRLAARFAAQAKELKIEDCRELAETCWQSSRSSDVRKLLSEWHGEQFAKRSPPKSTHIDPVCGMTVEVDATPFFVTRHDETVYFGSAGSRRQIVEVSEMFSRAHELGLFTVLWCYLRNSAFKQDQDYHRAADLTGQANHLGVSVGADLIKQKLAECNGGYKALNFGRTDDRVYDELAPDHPIEWTRYQVANCYMGRAGLINSGGASSGKDDLAAAVRTAVINKRAGGTGLITGRKAFQKSTADGVALLQAVQDVYLDEKITIA